MILLEAVNLTKAFRGLMAVNNVSFYIERGEILGLIGPNGAGKTTLFNLISGYYSPNGGRIVYKGEEIVGYKPYQLCKKGITRTFQLTKIYPNFSILDNVIVGAFNREKNFERGYAEALEILDLVGLFDKKERLGNNLNILDRKRVEVARALATKPELLMLDEVMSGLNPTEIVEFIKLIKDISKNGITIFLIEHIMKAIMTTCDRIIVLNYGQKISEGKPSEISKDKSVIEAYLGKQFHVA